MQVIASGNVDPPGVHETSYSVSSADSLPAPLPAKIVAPGEALRRLNRPAPVQWATVGITLFLQQGGVDPLRRPRGAGDFGSFFKRTTDRRKWFWWAVVGRGTATEFLYIDAVTGEISSQCAPPSLRRDSAPIPCPTGGTGDGPQRKINR